MSKLGDTHRDTQAAISSRRARLHGLLFAGAALGTTLLMLGATFAPKVPHLVGE